MAPDPPGGWQLHRPCRRRGGAGPRAGASGNTFHWTYTLALPVDGTVYEVQFDDWMYLIDDKVMLNRAQMRKFGIHLGDVTLSFHKR